MEYVLARILEPLFSPVIPGHRVYWLYLFSALLMALLVFVFTRAGGNRWSLKEFLQFCVPKRIYLHPSALLDYRYFIFNRIAFGLLLLPMVLVVVAGAAAATSGSLYAVFGEPSLSMPENTPMILLQTLLALLAMDLGLFIAHYLQHRVPVLWEFHKVHHSAEVLTPVTAYRMHPVDDVLAMSMAGFFSGAVAGVFEFLGPGNAGPMLVLGLNALLFVYYLVGYNLRHSHVWLSYGPVASRLFVSPAQHQIHHSKAKHHFDKNFGFIFAFWDQWFGTLYIPREKEEIDVGLPDGEDREYSSVRRLYLLPFAKATSVNSASAICVLLVAFVLVIFSTQGVMAVHAAFKEGLSAQAAQAEDSQAAAGEASTAREVFLDDLTWLEVRASISQGHTTVIVPTGGTEQNGPHMILGKHNYIVRHAASEVARTLGNALVAPVVAYVPEGGISPPTGHMRYAGTISLPERVFEAVLEHTARSLKAHGFRLICFLGDSGGNQRSQERVADRMNREWRGSGVRVLSVSAYYFDHGQIAWLEENGETKATIGTHAGIRDTSEMLFVRPEGIRADLLKVNAQEPAGAEGDPTRASAERGRILLGMKVRAAVAQIEGERTAMRSDASRKRASVGQLALP